MRSECFRRGRLRVSWDLKYTTPYGQKTRPGRCPEPELIALPTLMIDQARGSFCQGRFPASLISSRSLRVGGEGSSEWRNEADAVTEYLRHA